MTTPSSHGHGANAAMLPLVVLAAGVVFGDIGTSPLYAMKEAFGHQYGLKATDHNVLGILSMMFWSLTLIVTVKYIGFVMRADNRGEGGVLALMALAQRALPVASETGYLIGLLGIFGVALFFGDAVVTPAVSVLSAVEGLEVAAPELHEYVIPIAIGVLLALFAVQRRGTERIGRLFGPVMILYFLVIATLGIVQIVEVPRVLGAVNPYHAFYFATHHEWHAFFVLGAVVLAVTGAEALYADMGHLGKRPIQYAWLGFVFPALVLNYFGQGALLLDHPRAAENPFYLMVPSWGLYPMIVLATLATVIASQAVISGAFSVGRQAIQLGYLPRLEIRHTSEATIGQVYVPWINRLLLIIVMGLVIGFGSSSALAAAYGVAVTGTMLISSILLHVVAKHRWGWSGWYVGVAFAALFAMDAAFFGATVVKLADGAWFPLALGIVIFTLMRTWRRGRQLVNEEVRRSMLPIATLLASLRLDPPVRVAGTAVFLTTANDLVPLALLHNLKHNKVLHARNVLLTVDTVNTPRADAAERIVVRNLGDGFHRLNLRFGFMEDNDVPEALAGCAAHGLAFDLEETTFFASRETLVAAPRRGMALWRDRLYLAMARNTVSATSFFRIPGNRLVELGTHVEI